MTIKVLHIIKSLGRGGAETLLVETLKKHDRGRFEFQFLYFLPWKNQLADELHSAGAFAVHCMQAKNNIAMLLKVPALVRFLRKEEINLVHAHLPWAGIVARVACKWAGVPLIYTEHNVQERYHFTTRLLNRWTFKWQQHAVAVSSDVACSVNVNIDTAIPVSVVPNGIDTEKFQQILQLRREKRQSLGWDDGLVIVGTIAVFRQQKRLDIWLDAFFKAFNKNQNLRAVIVGDGPLKAQLHEQVKNRGLEKVVLFTGIQTDTPAWLSAFDIFMMSSDFEGLPLALLEAMASGCTVVATEAGGIPEVATHNDNALLSAPGNVEQLSAHLLKACHNSELRQRLGNAARQQVVANYSLQKMVNKLESLYISFYPEPHS